MDQFKRLAIPVLAGSVFALVMAGCATTATDTPADTAMSETAVATEPAAAEQAAANEPAASEQAAVNEPAAGEPAVADAAADTAPAASAPAAVAEVAEIVEPPRVVESCKKEKYTKFEVEARNSIKAGWEATKAERYGIGFRNADEYKQWSNTYNTIFKQANTACEALAKCATSNPKTSKKQCAAQAEVFRDWQVLAMKFTEAVKEVEHTQVEKICSLKPELTDPRRCFEQLAGNVAKACNSDECTEVAQCWQGMAFMDDAMRQAETACGFARTKLTKCRGYTEQQARRKAKLGRCSSMQEKLNLRIMPVL